MEKIHRTTIQGRHWVDFGPKIPKLMHYDSLTNHAWQVLGRIRISCMSPCWSKSCVTSEGESRGLPCGPRRDLNSTIAWDGSPDEEVLVLTRWTLTALACGSHSADEPASLSCGSPSADEPASLLCGSPSTDELAALSRLTLH
jgi:hypothetical protein